MYFQADIQKELPIETGSIDMVFADPPFNIKFDGKLGTYNRDSTNVKKYLEYRDNLAEATAKEVKRVLKSDGTAWIVMGWNNLRIWECAFRDLNFNQIGHVIWKYQFGVYTTKRPVTSHYHLLVYTKDKKRWTWNQHGYDEDVWFIKRQYKIGGNKYANKLPDELVRRAILRSSHEGDTVYDPFVGSGTTVKVAESINRIGIGSDILDNSEFWRKPYEEA